ncbi:hypothetical protein EW146_g3674 [Bondarzewia mesenterica]|uniref:SGNH hydrolase-type esterase domain-containing protein n=1 Tax=Bondarzewia mesenterica TaxID=1095465 RepID=A0A4V3XFD7_9AGAM|nr:hypothetical protein EW146_g3674 [Bondarzewia mesenterica]
MLTTPVILASVISFAVSTSSWAGRLDYNDGIHLAVGPICGKLGGNFTDVNAGIDLRKIKTIVSFGDSYTDSGKHDGSPLLPPLLTPPDPHAGGRYSDGPMWSEHIANDVNATYMAYAWSGAVVNITLWPSKASGAPPDFIAQVKTFLNQSNRLDPDSTLYTIFFGINDWVASHTDGDHLPEDAQDLLNQIRILASPPTNARNFLVTDVYGRGTHTASGEAWKQSIFDGLSAFHAGSHATPRLNVAFGDFSRIWDGVLGADYAAFGYTSSDSCLPFTNTTEGMCDDPKHTFYWLHGHPSNETERIMADYVEEVFEKCRVY